MFNDQESLDDAPWTFLFLAFWRAVRMRVATIAPNASHSRYH
jgi:hypothetical protein